jgi:hypothetical protein
MQTLDQLRLFADCLYAPDDIVEVRVLRIEPKHAMSDWVAAGRLTSRSLGMTTSNAKYDIYAGANPRVAYGHKDAAGVSLARCVFVEWDGITIAGAAGRLDAAGLPVPTCVVWSGGGVHCYWRLTEPIIDLELWRSMQKQMIRLLDSDKSIHDPPRIMRLPGFFNHKPGRTHSWLVYADPTQRVRASDLMDRCPPVEALPTSHKSSYVMPTARAFLLKRAAAYLARIPGAISGNHGHSQTYRAACCLAKMGLTEEEAMPLLEEYNERCDPPWAEKDLRRKYREAAKSKHMTRTPT